MKMCVCCDESYPATTVYFHKNNQSSDGLHPYCKVCRSKQSLAYRADPDVRSKMFLTSIQWAEANPKRVREIGRKYDRSLKATQKRRNRTGAVSRVFRDKENRFP